MAHGAVRIALVDGPLAPDHPALAEGIRLVEDADPCGPAGRHASAVADTIAFHAPGVRFVNLVVFGGRLVTSTGLVANALEEAACRQVPVVHCSWGLQRPDEALRAAIDGLVVSGRLVVSAAAARGGPVFPAAFPGVVSVQGDARCAAAQWSWLALPTAMFGACPLPPRADRDAAPGAAGASVAAAHLSGHIARLWPVSGTAPLDVLRKGAAFVGRERRTS